MKRKTALYRRVESLPLLPVPAGIEIVRAPAAVTILLADDAQCTAAQGTRVAKGSPLSVRPDPGSFASVQGMVRRRLPWDGAARGRFTAVIIDHVLDDSAPYRLFDPVNDPLSLPPRRCAGKAADGGISISRTRGADPVLRAR